MQRRRNLRNPRDGAEDKNTRKCAATGALRPPDELVRFTLDPAGRLTPDLASKLPGRGVYTTASREAVVKAAAKGLFAHALRKPSPLPEGMSPEGLADVVEKGLEERLLAALGLARRAGKLLAGFEKTAEALRGGNAALALVASDAGADGSGRISRLAHDLPILHVFALAAQSAAIGADWAIYAAALKGGEADRILREARRLAGFRPVFAARAGEAKTREIAGEARA